MPRENRSARTRIQTDTGRGPTVGVQGVRRGAAFQENPNASLGPLQAYLRQNAQDQGNLESAIGRVSRLAGQYQQQQARTDQKANIEQAKYRGLTGEPLDDALLNDPDAVDAFEATSGGRAGGELYQQFSDEVLADYSPDSGVPLEAVANDWIKNNLGDDPDASTFNLSAYDSFMSRLEPTLRENTRRTKAIAVNDQRAGLSAEIRNRLTAEGGLSQDWYEGTVGKARTMFPTQSDGWVRSWVLNQGMGAALRGGQDSRRAYMGMLNAIPEDRRPPNVDKVYQRFQQALNEGWSQAGDESYRKIQGGINQALRSGDPEALQTLYTDTLNAYRRYADKQSFRTTVDALNKASAAVAQQQAIHQDFAGIADGSDPFFNHNTQDIDDRYVAWATRVGALPQLPANADAGQLQQGASLINSQLENWSRSSVGIPDALRNVVNGYLSNASNPAAQQAAVLALKGTDSAVVDDVLKNNPEARARYQLLADQAATGLGEFAERSRIINDNLPAFRQAAETPIKDILGNEDIKSETGAWEEIIAGPDQSYLPTGRNSVGQIIAESTNALGAWGSREPELHPEVESAFKAEFRYQYALSRVRGDGASVDDITDRAAKSVGRRTYATPTGQGSSGTLGALLRFDGQVAVGLAEAGARATLGVLGLAAGAGFSGFSALSGDTFATAEQAVGDATRPNRFQLRLKKNPRATEVDGRPGYTTQNFEGSDTSPQALMMEDLGVLATSQEASYQVVESDHARQNYMTVQDVETQLPAAYAPGLGNEVSGPNGTFGFQLGDDPDAARANFDAAREQAGLPETVTILPSQYRTLGGQTYELVIGTRYPDDYVGAKPLREAKQAEAAQEGVNESLRNARTQMQSQGRVPPSEGITVFDREPDDMDANAYMQKLGDDELTHGSPGAGDDLSSNQSSFDQRRFSFLANAEGLRHRVYKDTSGHPTVGYGFNLNAAGNKALMQATLGIDDAEFAAIRRGEQTLTTTQARDLFDARMDQDGHVVDQKMQGIPISDEQRIALTSMVYNGGPDELDDELVSAFHDQDWPTVARKMLFDVGTASNAGLATRRWSDLMAALGSREVERLAAEGMIPDYNAYHTGHTQGDWKSFRRRWMS